MRVLVSLLSVGALSLCFLASGSVTTRADHTGGGMQAMSIDMNEEATPANTSSALGTRENCARINENDVLDADEDVVDGLLIDVTANGVPPYHDSSTPGDPSDDTGGITGFSFDLAYSSANLTVQALEHDDPSINIVARNAGSSMSLISDPLPDDNSDNTYQHSPFDSGSAPPESGSGVLVRITLVSETAAVPAAYPLTLSNTIHLDVTGNAYVPTVTNNDSYVAVNTACGDLDADGVADAQDACPTIPGPPSNAGCPPPGPPAVGGTAGLVSSPEDNGGSAIRPSVIVAAIALIASLAGGVLVRQLVARRARR
jgi:hypothetical protein